MGRETVLRSLTNLVLGSLQGRNLARPKKALADSQESTALIPTVPVARSVVSQGCQAPRKDGMTPAGQSGGDGVSGTWCRPVSSPLSLQGTLKNILCLKYYLAC